jgi:hypothetical protein
MASPASAANGDGSPQSVDEVVWKTAASMRRAA